jgi:hypothetical protein
MQLCQMFLDRRYSCTQCIEDIEVTLISGCFYHATTPSVGVRHDVAAMLLASVDGGTLGWHRQFTSTSGQLNINLLTYIHVLYMQLCYNLTLLQPHSNLNLSHQIAGDPQRAFPMGENTMGLPDGSDGVMRGKLLPAVCKHRHLVSALHPRYYVCASVTTSVLGKCVIKPFLFYSLLSIALIRIIFNLSQLHCNRRVVSSPRH